MMIAAAQTRIAKPAAALLGRAGEMRSELARRTALARQDAPEGVRGPALPLLMGEVAALWPGNRRELKGYEAVCSRPVMVLPGFGAHPVRMRPMINSLNRAGHRAKDWGEGLNLGVSEDLMERLLDRLERRYQREGAPLSLVGWSLGGLIAREMAKRAPEAVGQVITMGSPISGNPRANNAWRLYQFVTGHTVDAPPVETEIAAKPPVPTYALWSPRDGIIAPRAAKGLPGERDHAIALRCRHLGFASDPEAVLAVLKVLDADD